MSKTLSIIQIDAFETVPLSNVPLLANVEVIHIDSSASSKIVQRLSGLGIVPGTELKVLSEAPFKGPLQLEVRGTRLVLGRGLAEKILVRRGA